MNAKKTIGIIALGIIGISSVVWAAEPIKAPKEQTKQQVVCPYDSHDDSHRQCTYNKNRAGCGHGYSKLSPGHKNRCNWSGDMRGSCCQ